MYIDPEGKRFYTFSEAAKRLGVDRTRIYKRAALTEDNPDYLPWQEIQGKKYVPESIFLTKPANGELPLAVGTRIAFTNQKGGVGKTSLSVNLAGLLAQRGYSVTLIDLDPQGNATASLMDLHDLSDRPTVFELLDDQASLREVMLNPRENLFLLPADIRLSEAEVWQPLKMHSLSEVQLDSQFTIIDCPPSLGMLLGMALVACSHVVIPIEPSHYSLVGMEHLLKQIQMAMRVNKKLRILGVILNQVDSRANDRKQIRDLLNADINLFNTEIVRRVQWSRAPGEGKFVFEYENSQQATQELEMAADELLDRLTGGRHVAAESV